MTQPNQANFMQRVGPKSSPLKPDSPPVLTNPCATGGGMHAGDDLAARYDAALFNPWARILPNPATESAEPHGSNYVANKQQRLDLAQIKKDMLDHYEGDMMQIEVNTVADMVNRIESLESQLAAKDVEIGEGFLANLALKVRAAALEAERDSALREKAAALGLVEGHAATIASLETGIASVHYVADRQSDNFMKAQQDAIALEAERDRLRVALLEVIETLTEDHCGDPDCGGSCGVYRRAVAALTSPQETVRGE